MAFWQYSFWCIPKKSLIRQYGVVPDEITEDDFNDLNWFDEFDRNKFIQSIDCLSPNVHWNKKSLFWGSDDSDSITITIEDFLVRDIYIRIDLRMPPPLMLSKILRSLSLSELMILDEEMRVIAPEFDDFLDRIEIDINHKNNYFKDK